MMGDQQVNIMIIFPVSDSTDVIKVCDHTIDVIPFFCLQRLAVTMRSVLTPEISVHLCSVTLIEIKIVFQWVMMYCG